MQYIFMLKSGQHRIPNGYRYSVIIGRGHIPPDHLSIIFRSDSVNARDACQGASLDASRDVSQVASADAAAEAPRVASRDMSQDASREASGETRFLG